MRIIYRCEYEEKEGCETSRPDSPRWVTTCQNLNQQSMNRIDVISCNMLIFMPLLHGNKQIQLDFWIAFYDLIVTVFTISSTINGAP